MTKREQFIEFGKSAGIGFLLFLSSVLFLMIKVDITHLELISQNFFIVLGGYVLGTIVIRFLYSLKMVQRIAFIFKGPAIILWSFLFLGILVFFSPSIPDYIREITLVNIMILLCIPFGNYLYLRYIAKELNHGEWKKNFTLLEDLAEKPQDEDEFMEQVIQYCNKNMLDLEILYYGMPAKIKMGSQVYEAKLSEYCSLSGGIVYAIEFVYLSDI